MSEASVATTGTADSFLKVTTLPALKRWTVTDPGQARIRREFDDIFARPTNTLCILSKDMQARKPLRNRSPT